jgi:DNA-binding NarL/FixJ family response regulator
MGVEKMAGTTLTILLADDHTLVRETLVELLKKLAPEVTVVQAKNFSDVEKLVTQMTLDLAILDMVMPGMQGLQGLNILHNSYPALPIVILSGVAQPHDVTQAMRLGAAGFISKTIGGRGLLNALRMVLAGERYIPPLVLPETEELLTTEKQQNVSLTRREQEILQLLVTGQSNREIGDKLGVQEVTIKAHLRNLFNKLGVSNRTEAVLYLLGQRALQAGHYEDQNKGMS